MLHAIVRLTSGTIDWFGRFLNTGGSEYSFILIIGLIAIAALDKKK